MHGTKNTVVKMKKESKMADSPVYSYKTFDEVLKNLQRRVICDLWNKTKLTYIHFKHAKFFLSNVTGISVDGLLENP